jgi:hypothetical protein
VPTLRIAQDDAADDLLGRDPLALLIGMLRDHHVRQRSGGRCSGRRVDERLVESGMPPVRTDERRS